MGARGGAVGQGCWHAPVGRTWRGEPVALPTSWSSGGGLALLPRTCGMRFPSSTASVQPADPNHLFQPLLWCQCPMKARWELSMGGGGGQNPLPKPLPEQGLGTPLLSACSCSSLAAYL